jgi:hypothetical protein
MKRMASFAIVLLIGVVVGGCSPSHRLVGTWKLDHERQRQRQQLADNSPSGSAGAENAAADNDTTITFSGRSVTFQIDGSATPANARYHSYRYKLVSQNAQSVTVAVIDPSGSMKVDVFHFDDTDKDVMWLSDPAVNQNRGVELKMYFRRAP